MTDEKESADPWRRPADDGRPLWTPPPPGPPPAGSSVPYGYPAPPTTEPRSPQPQQPPPPAGRAPVLAVGHPAPQQQPYQQQQPYRQPPPHRPPGVPPPPSDGWGRPRRVDAIPGTPFGVVQLDVPPVISGLAIAALVAGIASILVSFIVVCFGITGAQGGWGAWAAGAFMLLAGVAGGGAVFLGLSARRQIQRPGPAPAIRFTGRGLATSGLVCGAVGLAITVLGFLTALFLQVA